MKFSYSLIKEITPNLPPKKKFAEEFALKSFEVDEIAGDMMDIKITANRWPDAASHEGIAKEAAVIFGLRAVSQETADFKKIKKPLRLKIIKESGCYRYIGVLAELSCKNVTPNRIKKYLLTCGIRTINPIVDILNYVMIETGQPMHVFDADKVEGSIIVRKAVKGEKITTIDGGEYELLSSDTVIADEKKILALAGIKGGKSAEITDKTKRIILESANFDSVSIYRTSKRIKLETDASRRYGHGMSSEKATKGINRAIRLLTETHCIKPIAVADDYVLKEPKKFIKFDVLKFKQLTGVSVSKIQASIILKKLGFKMKGDIAEVPAERIDVSIFEDLAEEVIRIYGLNEIKAQPPVLSITPIHDDAIIKFREKIKRAFIEIGFDEIISYSFGDYDCPAPELLNPISREKAFMRTNLIKGIDEAIEKNKRAFEEIKIFEFGKIFDGVGKEHWSVATAVKITHTKYPLRILRGAVEAIFQKIGISSAKFIPRADKLEIKIGDEDIGEITVSKNGEIAFFEANAEKLMKYSEGEFEYEPISPYPSVMRDISLWVNNSITVGKLFEEINAVNADNLNDVDLIDYYPDAVNKRAGVTFRLIFQSSNKTLTDAEVDAWMYKIKGILEAQEGVEIR